MDTRQLQTFITLADTLNYQRAADQLKYAPSSLFKHIQLLEEEIGTPLFFKSGRQLELTREGKRFLPDAQRLLAEWEEVLRTAGASEEVPALSIGGCELNLSFALRGLLQQFIAAYPDARFNMTMSPNADVPAFLKNDQADLCFYYSTSDRKPSGLYQVLLYSEPVCLMASREHPLKGKEEVTWEDLAPYPIFHPHETCVFFQTYVHAMKVRGLAMARPSFLGSIGLVAQQTRKEPSIMLVPYLARQVIQDEYGLEPLAFHDPSFRFWESIQYRKDADSHPGIRRMIRFAEKYADKQILADPKMILAPEKRGTLTV